MDDDGATNLLKVMYSGLSSPHLCDGQTKVCSTLEAPGELGVNRVPLVGVSKLDAHGEGFIVTVSDPPSDAEAPILRTEIVVGQDHWVRFRAVIAPHLPAVAED